MTVETTHRTLDELDHLLDHEREALLDGRLEEIARLVELKASLIGQLNQPDEAAREPLARIRENANELLANAVARYPDREFITELVDGKPDSNILDAAPRHKAELIVMGTHGRGGIEDLFLGSTAGKVVRKARCPVLTVRTPDNK